MAAPPVGQPSLLRCTEAELLDSDFVDIGVMHAGDPLPDDFVLQELFACDLDSPEAIRDLIEQYGVVMVGGLDAFEYLPRAETRRPGSPHGAVEIATEIYLATVGGHPSTLVSVEGVRLHLRAARAMTRHFLASEEEDDDGIIQAWPAEGFRTPKSLGMAWNWWQDHMNAALSVFQMYVEVAGPDGSEYGWQLKQPTLHNACALQLAQYVASDMRVLTCANDRCRKSFTRQRTSSKRRHNADQFHTSGVLYCSRECLKRKSERERYQRNKPKNGVEL